MSTISPKIQEFRKIKRHAMGPLQIREKHGKSVGNMRKIMEIEPIGVISQTCSSKLKTRDKGF